MTTLTVANHTAHNLLWSASNLPDDGGTPPVSTNGATIFAGGSLVLTLGNETVSAQLLLQSSDTDSDGSPVLIYKIDYKTAYDGASSQSPLSSMSFEPVIIDLTDGYGAEFDQLSYFIYSSSTPSIDATLDLFATIQTVSVPGYAVSLGDSPMTTASDNPRVFQAFVNSMFNPIVRARSAISAQARTVDDNPTPYADFSGGQIPRLVSMWTTRWKDSSKASCPVSDAALIDFLAGFIGRPGDDASPLDLWIPELSYRAGANLVRFELLGYKRNGFVASGGGWSDTTIERFLTLLASGAHFVVISATDDLKGPNLSFDKSKQMLSSFKDSGLTICDDPGNSHYADHLNSTGRYFLDIEGEYAPAKVQYRSGATADCGSLLSFLCASTTASTSDGEYNSFFQLEGWQAQDNVSPMGGPRHNADFAAYQETLWNISTFGASPFSERRGTTIFLAPHGWTPQPYRVTRMMPYVGAYARTSSTPQPWLHTDLVDIPSSAPALPSQFVLNSD